MTSYGRSFLDDMRRDPGYATENVVPVTADDALGAWLEANAWRERKHTAVLTVTDDLLRDLCDDCYVKVDAAVAKEQRA